MSAMAEGRTAMEEIRSACGRAERDLVRWAAGVGSDELPQPVLERAVRVLADDLAAIEKSLGVRTLRSTMEK